MDAHWKNTWLRSRAALVVLMLVMAAWLLPTSAVGQTDRGSISGAVVDPKGLPVTGVQVLLTDTVTGVPYPLATTDGSGEYHFVNLPIGRYALVFTRDGFKRYERNGITVAVSQEAKVNAKLQIGGTSQTVTVTSDADLIDSSTATEATNVSGATIDELPTSIQGGRNIASFIPTIVPAVNTVGWGLSVGNSLTQSINTMVDGIDSDVGYEGTSQPPGFEAVRAVQVETSGIDAESAQTGGGTIQYELKSGTNELHGSAFGIITNEALDANSWSNNYFLGYCAASGAGSSEQCPADYRNEYRRPNDRHTDWGFSAGGPIWKKHTFIFGAYERYNQNTFAWTANQTTVPTTQMLGGDFSQLLTAPAIQSVNTSCVAGQPCATGQVDAAGQPIYYGAIFDPANPGHVFPGNIIPQGRLSSQAQALVKIYQAHYAPTNANLTNNYWGVSGGTNAAQTFDTKLDHHFSDKHSVSSSLDYAKTTSYQLGNHNGGSLYEKGNDSGGPFDDVNGGGGWHATVHFTDTYTFTPSVVNNAIFAWNYAKSSSFTPNPAGTDFGDIAKLFPNISYASILGVSESPIGQDFNSYIRWQVGRLKDTVSWVHGRHVMKFGGEIVDNNNLQSTPGGILTYSFANTPGMPQAIANNSTLAPNLGFGFANMLLGEAQQATQGVTSADHGLRKAYDLIASDQFRATSKMTLNLSLRWDLNARLHEKNGNWSNFNMSAQNPTWPGLLGTYGYLSNGSQSWEIDEDYHLFSPHVGVAYQLPHNTVVRGAYGLFYVPLGGNSWGGIPYEACFQCFGSNQTAPAPSNTVAGFQWDQNVYPGVPSPAQKNPNANIGGWGSSSYVTPDSLRLGHTQNWNLGAEYSINKNTVLDVRYMGNRGGSLHDPALYPQNYPTWTSYQQLLLSGHAGDFITSAASAAAANVPWYPFLPATVGGYGGYGAVGAISPLPQVQSWGPLLVTGFPHGSSGFNGLITEVKKRTGSGLSMDLSYTFSHGVQNVLGNNQVDEWVLASPYQDPYSYNNFKNLISPTDIRHQVKGYYSYNLPIGRGARWLNQFNLLDYAVGGWTLAGDVNYQGGMPMAAVHAANSYPGWSQTFVNVSSAKGALSNHFKRLDLANLADPSNQFFNPAAFTDQTLNTNDPLYGTFGNQQPYYSNWRGWGYNNEDIAVIKHFGFGPDSRFKASLRGEFFNLLNRHTWANPVSGSPNSAYFGNVTGVSGNRTGQVGARLTW